VKQIAGLALKNHLPSAHNARDYAEAGGLLAYSTDIPDNFRRAAVYVDKILKGAKPGELPIERPMRFELVVNLKTAKALGISVPGELKMRADEIIQ